MEVDDYIFDILLRVHEHKVPQSVLANFTIQGILLFIIYSAFVVAIIWLAIKFAFGSDWLSRFCLRHGLCGVQVDDSTTASSLTDQSTVTLTSPSSPLRAVILRNAYSRGLSISKSGRRVRSCLDLRDVISPNKHNEKTLYTYASPILEFATPVTTRNRKAKKHSTMAKVIQKINHGCKYRLVPQKYKCVTISSKPESRSPSKSVAPKKTEKKEATSSESRKSIVEFLKHEAPIAQPYITKFKPEAQDSTDTKPAVETLIQNTETLSYQSYISEVYSEANESPAQQQVPIKLAEGTRTGNFSTDQSVSEFQTDSLHIKNDNKKSITESLNVLKLAHFSQEDSSFMSESGLKGNLKKNEFLIEDREFRMKKNGRFYNLQIPSKHQREIKALKSDDGLQSLSLNSFSRTSQFTKLHDVNVKDLHLSSKVKETSINYPRSRFGGLSIPHFQQTSPVKKAENAAAEPSPLSQTFLSPSRSNRKSRRNKRSNNFLRFINTDLPFSQNDVSHFEVSNMLRKKYKERSTLPPEHALGSHMQKTNKNMRRIFSYCNLPWVASYVANCSPKASFSSPSLICDSPDCRETMVNKLSHQIRPVYPIYDILENEAAVNENQRVHINKENFLSPKKPKDLRHKLLMCQDKMKTGYHFGLKHGSTPFREQTLRHCSKCHFVEENEIYSEYFPVTQQKTISINPQLKLYTAMGLYPRNCMQEKRRKMEMFDNQGRLYITSSLSSMSHRDSESAALYRGTGTYNRKQTSFLHRKKDVPKPSTTREKSSFSSPASSTTFISSSATITPSKMHTPSDKLEAKDVELAISRGISYASTSMSRSKSRIPVLIKEHSSGKQPRDVDDGSGRCRKSQQHQVCQDGTCMKEKVFKKSAQAVHQEPLTKADRFQKKSTQFQVKPCQLNNVSENEPSNQDLSLGKQTLVSADSTNENVNISPQGRHQDQKKNCALQKQESAIISPRGKYQNQNSFKRLERNANLSPRSPAYANLLTRSDLRDKGPLPRAKSHLNSDLRDENSTVLVQSPLHKLHTHTDIKAPTHLRTQGNVLKQADTPQNRRGPQSTETRKQPTRRTK